MRSVIANSRLRGLLLASVLAAASPAFAGEPAPAARADQLFRKARDLMDELRYAEACPMLEESFKLDPGGGTLLNLALCHEALNRTKTAYDEYKAVLERAQADKRPDRERVARERMANLEARVPTVLVRVAEADRDATILVDGAKIASGAPVRLDPGRL
jgi:tetratricopeptide (TPR) repeat protein